MNLKEAKKIALTYVPEITDHEERADAYIFYYSEYDDPIVIMKKDGRALNYTAYMVKDIIQPFTAEELADDE